MSNRTWTNPVLSDDPHELTFPAGTRDQSGEGQPVFNESFYLSALPDAPALEDVRRGAKLNVSERGEVREAKIGEPWHAIALASAGIGMRVSIAFVYLPDWLVRP